jgi:hypothetical protein
MGEIAHGGVARGAMLRGGHAAGNDEFTVRRRK